MNFNANLKNVIFLLGMRMSKSVQIQNVTLSIELQMANDCDQECDILVGQNFLDLNGVKAHQHISLSTRTSKG